MISQNTINRTVAKLAEAVSMPVVSTTEYETPKTLLDKILDFFKSIWLGTPPKLGDQETRSFVLNILNNFIQYSLEGKTEKTIIQLESNYELIIDTDNDGNISLSLKYFNNSKLFNDDVREIELIPKSQIYEATEAFLKLTKNESFMMLESLNTNKCIYDENALTLISDPTLLILPYITIEKPEEFKTYCKKHNLQTLSDSLQGGNITEYVLMLFEKLKDDDVTLTEQQNKDISSLMTFYFTDLSKDSKKTLITIIESLLKESTIKLIKQGYGFNSENINQCLTTKQIICTPHKQYEEKKHEYMCHNIIEIARLIHKTLYV